jgi:hypothetical protein
LRDYFLCKLRDLMKWFVKTQATLLVAHFFTGDADFCNHHFNFLVDEAHFSVTSICFFPASIHLLIGNVYFLIATIHFFSDSIRFPIDFCHFGIDRLYFCRLQQRFLSDYVVFRGGFII